MTRNTGKAKIQSVCTLCFLLEAFCKCVSRYRCAHGCQKWPIKNILVFPRRTAQVFLIPEHTQMPALLPRHRGTPSPRAPSRPWPGRERHTDTHTQRDDPCSQGCPHHISVAPLVPLAAWERSVMTDATGSLTCQELSAREGSGYTELTGNLNVLN